MEHIGVSYRISMLLFAIGVVVCCIVFIIVWPKIYRQIRRLFASCFRDVLDIDTNIIKVDSVTNNLKTDEDGNDMRITGKLIKEDGWGTLSRPYPVEFSMSRVMWREAFEKYVVQAHAEKMPVFETSFEESPQIKIDALPAYCAAIANTQGKWGGVCFRCSAGGFSYLATSTHIIDTERAAGGTHIVAVRWLETGLPTRVLIPIADFVEKEDLAYARWKPIFDQLKMKSLAASKPKSRQIVKLFGYTANETDFSTITAYESSGMATYDVADKGVTYVLHKASTNKGWSGSPLVYNNTVIGVHTGGQAKHTNVATPINEILNAVLNAEIRTNVRSMTDEQLKSLIAERERRFEEQQLKARVLADSKAEGAPVTKPQLDNSPIRLESFEDDDRGEAQYYHCCSNCGVAMKRQGGMCNRCRNYAQAYGYKNLRKAANSLADGISSKRCDICGEDVPVHLLDKHFESHQFDLFGETSFGFETSFKRRTIMQSKELSEEERRWALAELDKQEQRAEMDKRKVVEGIKAKFAKRPVAGVGTKPEDEKDSAVVQSSQPTVTPMIAQVQKETSLDIPVQNPVQVAASAPAPQPTPRPTPTTHTCKAHSNPAVQLPNGTLVCWVCLREAAPVSKNERGLTMQYSTPVGLTAANTATPSL